MEESASLEAEASGVGNLVGHQALPLPPPMSGGSLLFGILCRQ